MTKWRKMNSAPRDGTPILVGKWVKIGDAEPKWDQFVFKLNPTDEDEDEDLVKIFCAWTVIPKPPHWGKE